MGNGGNMKRIFGKPTYAVFSAVGIGFFFGLIKGSILHDFKSKESIIKALNCLGEAAQSIFIGFIT
jgi:hypothetical protein